MKSPNNEVDRVPTSHFLSPNEASSTRTGLNLTRLLAKGSHENPQSTEVVVKTISCSPKTDSRSPLPKTTVIQLTEHGEGELVPTYKLHFNVLASLVLAVTL